MRNRSLGVWGLDLCIPKATLPATKLRAQNQAPATLRKENNRKPTSCFANLVSSSSVRILEKPKPHLSEPLVLAPLKSQKSHASVVGRAGARRTGASRRTGQSSKAVQQNSKNHSCGLHFNTGAMQMRRFINNPTQPIFEQLPFQGVTNPVNTKVNQRME